MNRGDAYKLLAEQLNNLQAEGFESLRMRVGRPPSSEVVPLNGELIAIEVQIDWLDQYREVLQVSATASGPSTWMTDRLEESFTISPAPKV